MSDKDKRIAELESLYADLEREYDNLSRDYVRKMNTMNKQLADAAAPVRKKQYAGDVALDFWPLSDWARFGVTSKWSSGRYFQFVAGPIRFEIFEA